MPLVLMWYFIESSLITAWWNVVSTKHLRTHLTRFHIVHTWWVSRLWCDIGPRKDEIRKDRLEPLLEWNASVHAFFSKLLLQPTDETHAVDYFAFTTSSLYASKHRGGVGCNIVFKASDHQRSLYASHATVPALYPHWESVSVALGQLVYPRNASSRKVHETVHCLKSLSQVFFLKGPQSGLSFFF